MNSFPGPPAKKRKQATSIAKEAPSIKSAEFIDSSSDEDVAEAPTASSLPSLKSLMKTHDAKLQKRRSQGNDDARRLSLRRRSSSSSSSESESESESDESMTPPDDSRAVEPVSTTQNGHAMAQAQSTRIHKSGKTQDQDSETDSDSSEQSSSPLPARSEKIDVQGSVVSASDSEEQDSVPVQASNEDTRAESVLNNPVAMVQATQELHPPYDPPPEFVLAEPNEMQIDDTVEALSASSLQGKSIWYLTAPSTVSLQSMSNISFESIKTGAAILTNGTASYGLLPSNQKSTSGHDEALLLPESQTRRYHVSRHKIDKRFNLQRLVDLPVKRDDQGRLSNHVPKSPQSVPRISNAQPGGLRTRSHAFGIVGAGDAIDKAQSKVDRQKKESPSTSSGQIPGSVRDGSSEGRERRHETYEISPQKVSSLKLNISSIAPQQAPIVLEDDIEEGPIQHTKERESQSTNPNKQALDQNSKIDRKKKKVKKHQTQHAESVKLAEDQAEAEAEAQSQSTNLLLPDVRAQSPDSARSSEAAIYSTDPGHPTNNLKTANHSHENGLEIQSSKTMPESQTPAIDIDRNLDHHERDHAIDVGKAQKDSTLQISETEHDVKYLSREERNRLREEKRQRKAERALRKEEKRRRKERKEAKRNS